MAVIGLRQHFENLAIDYDLFVKMAEANWVAATPYRQGHYRGVKTMARILGISDVSESKYLKQYDAEIGRIRK